MQDATPIPAPSTGHARVDPFSCEALLTRVRLGDGGDLLVGVQQRQVLVLVVDGHEHRRAEEGLEEGTTTTHMRTRTDRAGWKLRHAKTLTRHSYPSFFPASLDGEPSTYPNMVKQALLLQGALDKLLHFQHLLVHGGMRTACHGFPHLPARP